MNWIYLRRQLVVGLIVGLLIIPAQPQTAQAQFGFGIVFDPRAYALQIQKRIEEANRWVETVRRYQEMYTKAVEQLTTLRGVLKTVDTTLFKNQQMALLANDIAKIVNDSQQLRRRLEGMIKYQIRSFKSIDDRLSQGIFDPEADLRDLQNYLLYTMGRDARQTVEQMLTTARADAQLATWMDEESKLTKEFVTIAQAMDDNYALLKQKKTDNPDDQINIQHLNGMISQQEQKLLDLTKPILELREKIAQRVKDHGLRLEDMENFGYEVQSTVEMWKELEKTKADLQKTLEGLTQGSPPIVE
jgi:hypothetical protein